MLSHFGADGSACCIQVYGVFSPRQVVSVGTQTQRRAFSPAFSSSVSHADSKWLPVTCCFVSYPEVRQTSIAPYKAFWSVITHITNTKIAKINFQMLYFV